MISIQDKGTITVRRAKNRNSVWLFGHKIFHLVRCHWNDTAAFYKQRDTSKVYRYFNRLSTIVRSPCIEIIKFISFEQFDLIGM